jgi:hypothetical protein
VCVVTHKQGEGLLVLRNLLFGEGIGLENTMVREVQQGRCPAMWGVLLSIILDNTTDKSGGSWTYHDECRWKIQQSKEGSNEEEG